MLGLQTRHNVKMAYQTDKQCSAAAVGLHEKNYTKFNNKVEGETLME